jgi:hypothetical protein
MRSPGSRCFFAKERNGRACVPFPCQKNPKKYSSKTRPLRTRNRIVVRLRRLSRQLPSRGETFRSQTRHRQRQQCNGRVVGYCRHVLPTSMPTCILSVGTLCRQRACLFYPHFPTFTHQFARPPRTRLPIISFGLFPLLRMGSTLPTISTIKSPRTPLPLPRSACRLTA